VSGFKIETSAANYSLALQLRGKHRLIVSTSQTNVGSVYAYIDVIWDTTSKRYPYLIEQSINQTVYRFAYSESVVNIAVAGFVL
jgi:hypothetical protein